MTIQGKGRKIWGVLFFCLSIFCNVLCIQNSYATATPYGVSDIREAALGSEDRSRQGLEMVFGSVVSDPLASSGGSAGSSSLTIVSSVFTVLNTLGLILGASLIGFVIVRKSFKAGNDGEVFKSGGDNAFSILRYVWGFSALVPTASGWSMAQLVVLWSASLMGVGTANLGARAAMDGFEQGQTMALEPAMPESKSLASALFQANLCAIGINKGLLAAKNSGVSINDSDQIKSHTITNTGFILSDESGSRVCGGATYPSSQPDYSDYLGITLDSAQYRQAQINALANMQAYLAEQSTQFADAVFKSRDQKGVQIPSSRLIIEAAARRYDQNLGSSSALANNKSNDIRQAVSATVKEKGWWELGSWYSSLAQANSVVTNNMLNRPQAVAQTANINGSLSSYYAILLSA